jgi:hypothetical protein
VGLLPGQRAFNCQRRRDGQAHFFDDFSLEDGLQFDETFVRGLARSLVAVPFVTAYTLARMCEANSEQHINYILLEWWLALVLAKAEGTTLRYILLIFCGEVGHGMGGGRTCQTLCSALFSSKLSSVFCWLAS